MCNFKKHNYTLHCRGKQSNMREGTEKLRATLWTLFFTSQIKSTVKQMLGKEGYYKDTKEFSKFLKKKKKTLKEKKLICFFGA